MDQRLRRGFADEFHLPCQFAQGPPGLEHLVPQSTPGTQASRAQLIARTTHVLPSQSGRARRGGSQKQKALSLHRDKPPREATEQVQKGFWLL